MKVGRPSSNLLRAGSNFDVAATFATCSFLRIPPSYSNHNKIHLENHPSGCSYCSTLPKTDSLPLKIGHPKRKQSYSNHPFHPFLGAMLVSGRVSGDRITPFYFSHLYRPFGRGTKHPHPIRGQKR